MATQPIDIEEQDDDVLELTDALPEPDEDRQENDEPDGDDGAPDFVGFADDDPEGEPPAQDNALVKHLREEIRKRDKRIADAAKAAPVEPDIVVGPKPTIEDFDYETDRFEEARDAWEDCKAAAERQKHQRDEAQRSQQQVWTKVTENYQTERAALRFADRDQAEQTAVDTLSGTAQALIAKHADKPALFMYAVGKSPAKLAELARIDAEGDPFAVLKAVTKMEATLTTKRSGPRPPNPDVPVRGKPISASGAEKHLQKLEAEADRTGDRTKIIAFKAAQKEKAK